MSQVQVGQPGVRDRLLAGLPSDDFAALAASLKPVGIELDQILHAPDEPVAAVHFPEGSMVPMLAVLESGVMQEAGVIGREWMVAERGIARRRDRPERITSRPT